MSTSPGLSPFAIFSTSGPTGAGAILTGIPNREDKTSAAGRRLNSGSGPPFGLPRWLIRINDAPWFSTYLIVGNEARMRLSSVTLPSCIGTLKSTRIRTRLPLISISLTVFLFMGTPDRHLHPPLHAPTLPGTARDLLTCTCRCAAKRMRKYSKSGRCAPGASVDRLRASLWDGWERLQTLGDHRSKISRTACVTPFVVVPSHDLDHVTNDKCIHGTVHAGEICAAQIRRD